MTTKCHVMNENWWQQQRKLSSVVIGYRYIKSIRKFLISFTKQPSKY